MGNKRDLVEVFGYRPDDLTESVRALWSLGACPFTQKACIKINHDQTVTYGTCSVSSPYGDIIICPNRLYANEYEVLRKVSQDAFGNDYPFLLYDQFIEKRTAYSDCIVGLGKNSGKEVNIAKSLSMDWVLAHLKNAKLIEYVGVEVQSIDITGNYRDAWHSYKNFQSDSRRENVPSSQHGLNWANVHKRLIPQLIRKSVVFSKSNLVQRGLYFVVPDLVFRKFEELLGDDIPLTDKLDNESITVYTYELGNLVPFGDIRQLICVRELRINIHEFTDRFISGPNLPTGEALDTLIKQRLGVS